VKTLADPGVEGHLRERFVLAFHNQLPELYCNTSVDPGQDRYPGDQVDLCPESAGGGNVRIFLCTPEGRIAFEMLGYWRPARFLEELRRGEEMLARPGEVEHLHRECRGRHASSADRPGRLLLRAHDEALADLGRPVREVLDRIEDEIYTKGRIG